MTRAGLLITRKSTSCGRAAGLLYEMKLLARLGSLTFLPGRAQWTRHHTSNGTSPKGWNARGRRVQPNRQPNPALAAADDAGCGVRPPETAARIFTFSAPISLGTIMRGFARLLNQDAPDEHPLVTRLHR